ncbi:Extradiol ring-cleavage dioxygenase class III enzyme subunit B [Lactarius akahatsu]|uniref:Extradiol ring-cleavage dioxygenase class III enzyme subunit B n=1 Tax=Lactarius akahatsu TaxID=416441 RepID=A0AAD4QI44_9AGAM|nr:Extradiol ring-cleavage dioxygenase class III enzyme subunit B [Lactarius akahatsu]
MASDLPLTRSAWQDRLATLQGSPDSIPSFFFGHGSPVLAIPSNVADRDPQWRSIIKHSGLESPLANFLRDFGPALLSKYQPKGILVFSAHWETEGEQLVTDYGDENPLFMDYYNFDPEVYRLEFSSRGDATLSRRVVQLFQDAGIRARLSTKDEARGLDGRGFEGSGLDHGVFVPFRLMFGEASIDGSLSPEGNWALGKAITSLREEGILILSGGLTTHNLRDRASFVPETASLPFHRFNDAVASAISVSDVSGSSELSVQHFVPIYVAAGAGEDGGVHVLSGLYGSQAVAFGV